MFYLFYVLCKMYVYCKVFIYLAGTGSFPGPDNSSWKQERSLAPEAGRHRSSMSGKYIYIYGRSS